jgi:hypothetical protein
MLVIIAIATEHSLSSVQNWFIASLGEYHERMKFSRKRKNNNMLSADNIVLLADDTMLSAYDTNVII